MSMRFYAVPCGLELLSIELNVALPTGSVGLRDVEFEDLQPSASPRQFTATTEAYRVWPVDRHIIDGKFQTCFRRFLPPVSTVRRD